MFGLFKRKVVEPVGPFGFSHSIEIERPVSEVYPLLDWADERNAKRQLGNRVDQVDVTPERYRLHLDMVPDHKFEMTMTEVVPGRTYAFQNEITPPVGRLVSSHETYSLEPLGEGSCRLGLEVAATFVGMSEEKLAREVMVMAMSCENALTKLKVHAEEGVDAVRAIEHSQMI